MCRLLGYASPDPTTMLDVLGDEQTARFQLMARLHDDGWGTMWLGEDGTLQRLRAAETGHDNELLYGAMRSPASTARVVHLRLATEGLDVHDANTHPFVFGDVGMAHNGSIVPKDGLRAMLDEVAYAGVEGTTDSELYFALIRQHLDRGLTPGAALAASVNRIRESYPSASLNAMLLSPTELCVVRSSARARIPVEEFDRSGLSKAEFPLHHREAYFRMSFRELPSGGHVFASAGLLEDGWTELAEDTVARLDLVTGELQTVELSAVGAAA